MIKMGALQEARVFLFCLTQVEWELQAKLFPNS